MKSLRLFVFLKVLAVQTVASAAVGLSGQWIFESRTSDGLLRAKLELMEEGRKLFVTLWIDNHVLKGEGETDGMQFDVILAHADGSGSGHDERIRVMGKLDGNRIIGAFESGTERGLWVAVRQ